MLLGAGGGEEPGLGLGLLEGCQEFPKSVPGVSPQHTPSTLLSSASPVTGTRQDTAHKPSSECSWQYFTECQEEFIKLPDQTGADEGMGNQCCFNKCFAFEKGNIPFSGKN